MTIHERLLQAISNNHEETLDTLLKEADIDVKDAHGLTVTAKIIMKDEGSIAERIKKAWALHDRRGAPLHGIVRGLAAVGQVNQAYDLCEYYDISPIEVALGLAYTGDKVGLERYFERCTSLYQDQLIKKVETTGILAHALCTAAAIYGDKQDLAQERLHKTQLIFFKSNHEEIEAISSLSSKPVERSKEFGRLYTHYFCIILEAAGVTKNVEVKEQAFTLLHDIKNSTLTGALQSIGDAFIPKDVLAYWLTSLAKGGMQAFPEAIIQELRLCGFTEEEMNYCKMRGYAQAGDVASGEKLLKSLEVEDTRFIEFCVQQYFENGYPNAAIYLNSIDGRLTSVTQLTASVIKGHTPSIDKNTPTLRYRWETTKVPSWMHHTLTSSMIKPMHGCKSYYSSDGGLSDSLQLIGDGRGPYTDDRLPRPAYLSTRYKALHYLCFADEEEREKVIENIYAPVFGEEKATIYLKIAKHIDQIRTHHKVGFTAAMLYYHHRCTLNKARSFVSSQKNLSNELRLKILSAYFDEPHYDAFKELLGIRANEMDEANATKTNATIEHKLHQARPTC